MGLLLWATAAYAADVVAVVRDTPTEVALKIVAVLCMSVLGWAAGSLSMLADWDVDGGRNRWVIFQGVAKSLFFGTCGYLVAVAAGRDIMACLLAVASASFGGEVLFKYKGPGSGEAGKGSTPPSGTG